MIKRDFYNDRIHNACAGVYRHGLLYAALIAFCYGVCHFSSMIGIPPVMTSFNSGSFYIFFLPEISVFLGGIILWLIGYFRHRNPISPEEKLSRHNYYLLTIKIMIVLAFGSYALTLPFTGERLSHDVPQNHLVLLFETIGVIYLYFALKKRDIFFNYDFIETPKKEYYTHVFLNLGKMCLWVLPGFLVAAFIDLALHQSIWHFTGILAAWILSLISLGLEYLFISWTEKLSYDEKEHRGLHLGTFVKFLFLLANTFVALWVTFLLLGISHGNLGDIIALPDHHLEKIIERLSELRQHFAHESSVLTAMVMCKFMCQIRDCRKGRVAITGMVILTAFTLFWDYLITFLQNMLSLFSIETIVHVITVSTIVSLILTFINAILWSFLIYDLIQTEGFSPLLWVVAGVRWFLAVLNMISSLYPLQGLSLFYALVGGPLGFAALLLLLILLHRHQYPHEHEEFV
ncbi:MAG: hypothetical protein E7645_01805 [Ruminococcaceae bacterium]|nr:hypothetical protein [Oscillospiraceae bacterium]